jgi:hypothetical protein
LRKTIIAAVAATTVLGGGAVARAAIPADDASMKVTVQPQKAGTKKKPRNTSLHLKITNKNIRRTLSKLQFQFPKTVVLSSKGLPQCNAAQLESSNDPSVCPKGSKAGVGTAIAYQGVAQPQPNKLTFDVTPYIVKNGVDFYIASQGALEITAVSPGRVKQTKKGPLLTIRIPEIAQQAVGAYNGLGQLDTVIDKQVGKHKLIATTGCKNHKQPVSGKMTFIDNGVTEAGTLTVKAAAKCS